jgi:hypothetical protein
MFRADNPVSSIPFGECGYTMQDVIMDYGSTGISIRLFVIILAGMIAGLFAVMRYGLFETGSTLGILLISVFILVVAVQMIYQDIKKASIGFTRDAITLRQPLFRPVTIAKDTISLIEVRENIHHSHRWLFRGALLIILAGVIPTILYGGQTLSLFRVSFTVFLGYYLAVLVFFGLMFYHGYIRSRYSQVIAICTINKKIVGLYVDDPGKISDMLSTWRAGSALRIGTGLQELHGNGTDKTTRPII